MYHIINIFWIVFILFIWMDTDFFTHWSKLLGLRKKLKIDKWESYKSIDPKISYLDYLFMTHNGFFTKLISCRVCILFWIVLVFTYTNLYLIPVYYFFSYIVYTMIKKL